MILCKIIENHENHKKIMKNHGGVYDFIRKIKENQENTIEKHGNP